MNYIKTLLLFSVLVLLNVFSQAQRFELLKDIKKLGPLNVNNFIVYKNHIYFIGNEKAHGDALWKSDGTEDGTELFLDPIPGSYGHINILVMVVFNDYLFISCAGKLWRSDGSREGTEVIKEIQIDSRYFVVYDNSIYFTGNDSIHGYELWKSDGTAAGTKMLVDIYPGTQSSYPRRFIELNGRLTFWADDGVHSIEPWISDGSAGNTYMIKDINAGAGYSLAGEPVAFQNKLYFPAYDGINNEFWVSDGTELGTQPLFLTYGFPPTNFIVYNNLLYFSWQDTSNTGTELWSTDGTLAGTQMVKDINPGNASSFPEFFKVFNGKLFFYAKDGVTGKEIWYSDGTAAGTQIFKDIYPGSGSQDMDFNPYEFNGRLYFVANDSVHWNEIWSTDGTPADVQLLKDISTIAGGGYHTRNFVEYKGKLYFNGYVSHMKEGLWATDGTSPGTLYIKPGDLFGNSNPFGFTALNEKFLFNEYNLTNGVREYGLWVSDGTPDGTQKLSNINFASSFTIDNLCVFESFDSTHGRELWVTDGTPGGTLLLKDIYPGLGDGLSFQTKFVQYNEFLYFMASHPFYGWELWRTDGTSAGTTLFADLVPGMGSSVPRNLIVFKSELYFTAFTNDIQVGELFATNGTPQGTRLVKDFTPTDAWSHTGSFTVALNKLFFLSDDGIHGTEIWISDGTETGTIRAKDIFTNLNLSDRIYPFYDQAIFWVYDSIYGMELWLSNGTQSGTELIKDIALGAPYSDIGEDAVVFNNEFYFSLRDSVDFNHYLWKTDGTQAGTMQVFPKILYPSSYTIYNNELYFKAAEDTGWLKLCWLDSLGNFNTAPIRPYTEEIFVHNNRIYFSALHDTAIGIEPYWFSNMKNISSALEEPDAIFIADQLNIYPNPTSSVLEFNWLQKPAVAEINIHSSEGKLLFRKESSLTNGVNKTFLPYLKAGVYIFSVTTSEQIFSKKILIQ